MARPDSPSLKKYPGLPPRLSTDLLHRLSVYAACRPSRRTLAAALGLSITTLKEWLQRGEEDYHGRRATLYARFYRLFLQAPALAEIKTLMAIYDDALRAGNTKSLRALMTAIAANQKDDTDFLITLGLSPSRPAQEYRAWVALSATSFEEWQRQQLSQITEQIPSPGDHTRDHNPSLLP